MFARSSVRVYGFIQWSAEIQRKRGSGGGYVYRVMGGRVSMCNIVISIYRHCAYASRVAHVEFKLFVPLGCVFCPCSPSCRETSMLFFCMSVDRLRGRRSESESRLGMVAGHHPMGSMKGLATVDSFQSLRAELPQAEVASALCDAYAIPISLVLKHQTCTHTISTVSPDPIFPLLPLGAHSLLCQQ